MAFTAAAANAYQGTKIKTASPAELTLMLYDGAIKFCNMARIALEKNDYERAKKHLGAILFVHGLEFKQRRARDYCVIDVKMRIFGGGRDERYSAVLYVFKQRLLLFAVEILYLVDVEQYSARAEHIARGLQNLFYVGN